MNAITTRFASRPFSLGARSIPSRFKTVSVPRNHRLLFPIATRTMSTSEASQSSHPAPPASKNEWLVIAPDKPDALQRRLAVRPKHLEVLKELQDKGIVSFVGVMLGDHPKEGETPSFKGGVISVHLDTKEDVEKLLKEDVYTSNDVWDWEKMQILPFRTAIRKTV